MKIILKWRNIMTPKIAVITSHFLEKPTREALSRIELDCDFIFTTYDNFKHIPKVYDQFADLVDGFLVSGNMAKSAIEVLDHEVKRPIISFNIDLAGLYETILKILIENPNQKVDRIIMDFLIAVSDEATAKDFIDDTHFSKTTPVIENWIHSTGAKEMEKIESIMTERILKLYKDGKMDLVICQFTNLIPFLEEHDIPYKYPFPPDSLLRELVQKLIINIELEHMRDNMLTIINVAPCKPELISSNNMALLKQQISAFLKENLMDCLVQEEAESCNIFTTVQVMHSITRHGKSCEISDFLIESLPFPIAVGYGVGININNAMTNALSARREAIYSGHSFIKNENGDLIGPLNSDKRMIIENYEMYNVAKIAKKCNLSSITITKLITYMKMTGSNKVTTQELASRFGVTVRNANRILLNLENGNFAKLAYTQTSNSKGRPAKVYELNFKLPALTKSKS